MKTRIIFSFLILLFSSISFAEETVSFDQDVEFIMVEHDLWYHQSMDTELGSVQENIQLSKDLLETYKQGDLPTEWSHSQEGLNSFFLVADETVKIFETAEESASDYDKFLNIVDRELVGLRQAVMLSKSHEELRANVVLAVKEAINDILNNGESEGTISELQFIYKFIYDWEDTLLREENESPSQSGTQYIDRSEKAFGEIKSKSNAPSDRSLHAAVSAVQGIIKIYKKANSCSSTFQEFTKLVDDNVGDVYAAIEKGLTQDKSVRKFEKNVSKAVKKAIHNMNCK